MMKKRVLSLVILLLVSVVAIAQRPQYKLGINVTSGFRNQVLLELQDSTQALLLTRTGIPNSVFGVNAYRGMIVLDSVAGKLAYFDGVKWAYPIDSSSVKNIYNLDGTLTGARRVNLNSNALSFANGTTDSLYLTGGRVGISVNPISKLHVKGAMRADSLVLNSLNAGDAISDSILTINTLTGVVRRVSPSTIKPAVDTSIYAYDGTLKSNRVVTMGNNNLTFNSVNGNFIYNPTGTGKMGIGTNVPYTKLDVLGDIYLTNHSDNSHHATSERVTRRIGQKSGNGTDGFNGLEMEVLASPAGGTENAGIIKFFTWGSGISSTREVARIDPFGNMGIGVSPISKLHVKGAMRADSLVLNSLNAGDAISDSILTINTLTGVVRRVSPSTIKPAVDTSIYAYDGTLKSNRVVTMGSNSLTFAQSTGTVNFTSTASSTDTAINILGNISGVGNNFSGIIVNSNAQWQTTGLKIGNTNVGNTATYELNVMGSGQNFGKLGIYSNKSGYNLIIDTLGRVSIGNNLAFALNAISALQVKGAVRADSLALVSLLNKNTMTTRDSLLMIDSAGVVKKVSASTVTTAASSVASVTAGVLNATKNNNGITINPNTGAVIVQLQEADAGFPGLVSTGVQTFAGNKTFNGQLTALNVPVGTLNANDSILVLTSGGGGVIKKVAKGSSLDSNIYNSNGSLTSARVVTMGAYPLTFTGNTTTFQGNNPISLLGLQSGTLSDSILTINSGVVKKVLPTSLFTFNLYNKDSSLTNSRTVGKSGKFLRFVGNSGDTVALASNGNMSIGTTDSTYKLNVKGYAYSDTVVTRAVKLVTASGVFSGYGMSGNWGITTVSDSNLKENIKAYNGPNALQGINNIKIVEYDWKSVKKGDPNRHMPIGVIAQNVQRIFPDAVEFDSKSGNLTLRNMLFSFYLMKATQELSKEVDNLKKENQSLNKQVDELKKGNSEFLQRIDKLEQMMKQMMTNKK